MKNNESVTVKITMPKEFAEEFLNECDKHFYGVRYLNILYKSRLLETLVNNADEDIMNKINDVRKEMFIYLKHKQFWEK